MNHSIQILTGMVYLVMGIVQFSIVQLAKDYPIQQMKSVRKTALVLLMVLLAMQFYRPEKNISQEAHMTPFLTETNPPADVKLALEHSCTDCHSDHTVYPWYNTIAPVSLWTDGHIRHGKGSLNFSSWNTYIAHEKVGHLKEIANTIENGTMPVEQYTWMHPKARLSKDQKESIIEWAEKTSLLYQLGRQPK